MVDLEQAAQAEEGRTYRIGTVSSLAGIDAHTIPAWQRRFGTIEPMRSDFGRRLCSDDTADRLQLLKGLIDCRGPISTIAPLPDEQLRQRLEKLAMHESQTARLGAAVEKAEHRPRAALFAPWLSMQIAATDDSLADFEVMLPESNSERFLEGLRSEPYEAIVFELESVREGPVGMVQACGNLPGDSEIVVLSRFAPRRDLARLARAARR